MDSLLQDIRYSVRSLIRRPGFTSAVVLTLALGIGANTAIFSFVNGVLFRPLPFRDADRLMVLWTMLPNWGHETASYPDFADWRQSPAFERVTAYANSSDNLAGGDGEPVRVRSARVSSDFLPTLGLQAQLGRGFVAEDTVFGAHRLVMLSHGLWQRRFGGDPAIVGQTITLNALPYTVVGVAPPTLRVPEEAELWTPLANDPSGPPPNRRSDYLHVIARLKAGMTEQRAQADLDALAKRLAQSYPQTNAGVGIDVVPLHDELVGPIRSALLVFAGAVGLVLLIACANVANLLLARAAARDREMAVRVSLGAARNRILRQLLTESLLLSLVGGALGLALSVWGVAGLKAAAPDNLPRLADVRIDVAVLAFTALVSLFTGVLFGLAPALRLSRMALQSALTAGGRGGIGGGAVDRLRGSLVLAQVALALVLLVGAGLLIRTFQRLQDVQLGFEPRNVVAAVVVVPRAKYREDAQAAAFFEQLRARVAALPGVSSAGLTTDVPLQAGYGYNTFAVVGRPPVPPGSPTPDAVPTVADEAYFRTIGIPLLAGRLIGPEDGPTSPRVALVNREMVRRHFGGRMPIGERVTWGDPADSTTWMTIIGVVGDTRLTAVGDETYPQIYQSVAQRPQRALYVVARTSGDAAGLVSLVRREVTALDPAQPISDARTMEARVAQSIAQPKANSMLVGAFAFLALALAAIGIYAVMSYTIAQRTRELGIRMALGATAGDVLRLVVRQGMTPAVLGVMVGLGTAFAATRLMSSLLFGVRPADPITFGAVTVLLLLIALLACYLPARNAARVDPNVALRYE